MADDKFELYGTSDLQTHQNQVIQDKLKRGDLYQDGQEYLGPWPLPKKKEQKDG